MIIYIWDIIVIVLFDETFSAIDVLRYGSVGPPLPHVAIFIKLSTFICNSIMKSILDLLNRRNFATYEIVIKLIQIYRYYRSRV